MAKPNYRRIRRAKAYCEAELAKADLDAARRAVLTEKLRHIDRALVGRCRCCGRGLENPTSVAEGIGPECRRQAAS